MDKPGYVIIACCGCGVNNEELIRRLLTERELMEKQEVPTPEMPSIEDGTDSKEKNTRDYMAYMRSRRGRRQCSIYQE